MTGAEVPEYLADLQRLCRLCGKKEAAHRFTDSACPLPLGGYPVVDGDHFAPLPDEPECPRCRTQLRPLFASLAVQLTADEVDAMVCASLLVGNCPECYVAGGV